jgi:4a-hydroxytetrahydrobiopterin dehydratase
VQNQLLKPEELEELIKTFPKWEHHDKHLKRNFEFHDFKEAFGFMTQVAEIAETLNHHPDWSNSWNEVLISISTHSAGGLTLLDFKFIEEVELIIGV